jgi:hypothetical protein
MRIRTILIGLVGLGVTAQLLLAEISPVVFRVEAANAAGAGVWEVPFDEDNYDRATDTETALRSPADTLTTLSPCAPTTTALLRTARSSPICWTT